MSIQSYLFWKSIFLLFSSTFVPTSYNGYLPPRVHSHRRSEWYQRHTITWRFHLVLPVHRNKTVDSISYIAHVSLVNNLLYNWKKVLKRKQNHRIIKRIIYALSVCCTSKTRAYEICSSTHDDVSCDNRLEIVLNAATTICSTTCIGIFFSILCSTVSDYEVFFSSFWPWPCRLPLVSFWTTLEKWGFTDLFSEQHVQVNTVCHHLMHLGIATVK